MVMQDGGAVDVRPDPDPGRAAQEHSGGYLAAGLCLAVCGGALAAWTVYDTVQRGAGAGDFVESLFNPGAFSATQVVGPGEWAFAAALLVVAVLLLAQRRVARTAALLCGFVLLAAALREGVGLLDAAYRAQYDADPRGGWALATHGLGLVTALVVPAALLPATERRDPHARARTGTGARPGPDARSGLAPGGWWRRPSRICGVLFLVLGVARLAWTVWDLTSGRLDTARYLRGVVDAAVPGDLRLAATAGFTTVGTVIALLLLGVLAFRGRRDVRGALLVCAAVQLYLTVRGVVWLTVSDFFNHAFDTVTGALSMALTAYALAATTSVVVLATGRARGPYGGVRAEAFRAAPDGRYGER
ncbi:hypothetical protein [Streptomyces celluloflavus]|uniref:hypothetical protein n=1 Tax=Streptomyces celluloflavus TaxID=58344 RepID=UPI003659721D